MLLLILLCHHFVASKGNRLLKGATSTTRREYLLQQIRCRQSQLERVFPGEEKQKALHTLHPARFNKSHKQAVITRNCLAKGKMRKRSYLQAYSSHGKRSLPFWESKEKGCDSCRFGGHGERKKGRKDDSLLTRQVALLNTQGDHKFRDSNLKLGK